MCSILMPDVSDWTPPRDWTRLCVQYLLHRFKRVFVFKLRTRPCVQNVFHEEHMCSSAAHWKCSILQNTFKVFNICCIVGVKLCSIPEHMFLNTCKRSVPSDQLVFFLVKPFSTWCSNSVLSPLTLWCSILQNTFKVFNICCDFGVQMVF